MRILKSLHGQQVGLGADGRLICPGGLRLGDDGSQFILGSPSAPATTDDFTGKTMSTNFTSHKGSDGGCVDFAINAAVNGTIRGTTGAGAGATMAVNGVQVDSGLIWQANQGGLYVEARLKLSQITTIQAFVGFTDQISALEAPVTGAGGGDTFTTNATDAVGFVFDTTMTTKNWWLVGVANDVDATQQNSALAPVAATYATFRVELDALGNATFFYNSKAVGTIMAAAVTKTIPLSIVVESFTRAAGSATVDIDYVSVGATRA